MINLKNGNLTASVSEKGAELVSVVKNGKEYIWSGDARYWARQAPTLFPMCGAFSEDKFVYGGKEYHHDKHGFARNMVFKAEKTSENSVTLLLTETQETLLCYPFKFELRVTYTLSDDKLKVDYVVKNTNSEQMYFSIGSHEGYACDENAENYELVFEEKETLCPYEVENNLLSHKNPPLTEDSQVLRLKDDYFRKDALVFKDHRSRSVVLRKSDSTRIVKVEFSGFDGLLIWKPYKAPLICIEPWSCTPPMINSGLELSKKEGITALSPKESKEFTHIITFY